VLYADDDSMNWRLMSSYLGKLGCTCEVVKDGDEVWPALCCSGQLAQHKADNVADDARVGECRTTRTRGWVMSYHPHDSSSL
jgi:CheY-like chemotaxis protein